MTNQNLDPAKSEEARRLVLDIRQRIEEECASAIEKIATFGSLTIECGGFPVIGNGHSVEDVKESARKFSDTYYKSLRKQKEKLALAFLRSPLNVYDGKGYYGLSRN